MASVFLVSHTGLELPTEALHIYSQMMSSLESLTTTHIHGPRMGLGRFLRVSLTWECRQSFSAVGRFPCPVVSGNVRGKKRAAERKRH